MTETLFSETRQDVLETLVINAIREHLRCENAAIYKRAENEALLECIASVGIALPDEYSRAESGIVGRADHWQVPIWLNRSGPGDSDLKSTLEKYDLDAVICTPVRRGTTDMVFFAARSAGAPPFQMADIELLNILARQAHAALENARLYQDLRGKVRQIETSQRALIQAEKMAAVGRLTASIAHEINNPLQGLQNCLHLARRVELSLEKREEYLDMAEEELERLMTTVQRMLDYYRPGAMDRSPADINELLKKTLALLHKQLKENHVTVKFMPGEGLPAIPVVANQVQQVFFNLIINAMEAMPDGGELSIVSQLERSNGAPPHIEMRFTDSGTGIASQYTESVFEPFYSTKDKGSGLGLSVSYGILTAHGGALELVPVKGPGACFKVLLPVKEA
jgi:signal transduction histidine kinase